MKKSAFSPRQLALLALLGSLLTACETTDGGGSTNVNYYYGSGFADPWYYGGYYNDVDVIVTPPPGRPSQPIARPPVATPRPMPMPSIPARPMPRGR